MIATAAQRGFSLIELVLVIALIGVLVSLVVPSLGTVRRTSQEVASLGNLRTHATTMAAYSGDYDDYFPSLGDPEATWSIIRHNGVTARVGFFDVHTVWNLALASEYYGGDHLHRSFTRPWGQRSHATEYYLSHALMTRPEYWRPETRIGPSQWRGSRVSEALFPSSKGVIVERDITDGGTWSLEGMDGVRFSCADGSARDWRHKDFNPPYFPLFYGQGSWTSYMSSRLVMHTIDGVRGRDFN